MQYINATTPSGDIPFCNNLYVTPIEFSNKAEPSYIIQHIFIYSIY